MKEKYKVIGLEGLPSLYLKGTRFGCCPIINIILKDKVDIKALKCSVKKAKERYLLLNCKIIRGEYNYHLEENEKDFIIKNIPVETDRLHGKDTNDYPWLVSYYNNYLAFSFDHSLMDGVGAFEIVKTILYYYATYKGIEVDDFSGVKTLNDNIDSLLDEEMELSLENYNDKSVIPLKEKQLIKSSSIPQNKLLPEDVEKTSHRIVIDVDTLIPTLKKYETTPFAIIVPLFSRAIKHLFDEENPVIRTETVVNYRPFVGSKTLRNFIHLAPIEYNSEKMDKLPLEMVSTIFRSILDVKLNKENVISSITSRYENSKKLEVLPLEQKEYFVKQGVQSMNDSSFVFSYTGKINLPKEVENLVENIELHARVSISPIMIEAIGYQNKLTLIIANELKDTSYLDKFVKILEDLSVSCTLEKIPPFPTSVFDV